MSEQFLKSDNADRVVVLDTHNIGVNLPMNTKYLTENPLKRWLIRRFIRTMIAMISSVGSSIESILDVGCGEGIVPRQLHSLWPSANFHGIDIDPELLAVARKLIPGLGCVAGSIYKLPCRDRTYDLVCCTEVMEHLDFPDLALAEIVRVGKQFFLFSVPNEPYWRIANMARGAYLFEWGNSPGHLNHWSIFMFIRLLSGFFEVVDVQCPFPWIIVLCRKK